MRQTLIRLAAVAVAAFAPAVASSSPPTPAYRLVFADEFNGTGLDPMNWSSGYPWGNTHNHDAVADPAHAVVADGNLTLVAERREPTGQNEQDGKPFVTGVVSTGETRVTFDRGYVEARIKLPTTPGSWPAFWGLFTGWPPEADVMEFPLAAAPGGDGYPAGDYHTAFHFKRPGGGNGAGAGRVRNALGGRPLNADYHTFAMEWVKDRSVRFFLDQRPVGGLDDAAAVTQMRRMYLILNYAVGGWPGTPTLQQWPLGHEDRTRIDWVRVWQLPENGDAETTRWTADAGGEWDDAARWAGGPPRFQDQVALLSAKDGHARTLAWTGPRTVGGLAFAGDAPFVVGGDGAGLMLARTRGDATVTATADTAAPQRVAARLELWSDARVSNFSDQPLTLAGAVVGAGGLTVRGTGTVVLAAADNAYRGPTAVESGTLRVDGAHAGGGPYRVAANATLAGGGTLAPAVTDATVTVAGTLAPGTGVQAAPAALTVGSVDVPSDVALAPGGRLAVGLGPGGASDRLHVFGKLDLRVGGDELALLDRGGAFDGSTYTLATFARGTLAAGRFNAVTLDGEPFDPATRGYRLDYDDAAGRLLLAPAP